MPRLFNISFLPLLLLLPSLSLAQTNEDGSIPLSAASTVPDAIILDPRTTVLDYISTGSPDFEVLLSLLITLNLTDTLASPAGRVTLLAPTDAAFIDLIRLVRPDLALDLEPFDTPSIVDALLLSLAPFRTLPAASFASPRDILAYHILNDALDYESVDVQSPLNTTAGVPISVVDGLIVDQDPQQAIAPSVRNIFNLNGWVHVVPQVLLPFDLINALNMIPTPSPTPSLSATPSIDPSVVPEPVSPTVTPTPVLVESPAEPTPPDSDVMIPTETPMTTDEELEETDEGPMESPEEDEPICFPASATVELVDGSVVSMPQLEAGHQVRVHESGTVSNVFAWTHRMLRRRAVFYVLRTESGHEVRMTGGHYLYANRVLTVARAVKIGDVLRTVGGESKVVKVGIEKGEGLFAPHTMHGDLVVDGVVVSGYSRAVAPWVAHALLAPVRGLVRWGRVTEPLGGLFYEGADEVARWMPSGRERY